MSAVKFGSRRTQEIVNVYLDDIRVGSIRRQDGKEKFIWFPSRAYPSNYPFVMLDTDIESSEELVRQLFAKGVLAK